MNWQQIEIEFFWPLTEQLPLDLDYTESDILELDLLVQTLEQMGC
jgi:hypothetical protein